jgi:ABC-2 type transport system permease protein
MSSHAVSGGRGMDFLQAVLSFTWLEWKTLRYYPSNLLLSLVEGSVNTGIWLFIGLFLKDVVSARLDAFGGSYVSYVVLGVAFFEAAQVALVSPYQTVSLAFWDKRLEAYHLAARGIWAHILGRFLWQLGYALTLQLVIVTIIVATVGIEFAPGANPALILVFYTLFVGACFGLGLASASMFFLLEIKEGAEPVAWTTTIIARIASGIYYPLSVLPAWVATLGYLVPHTYALRSIRLVLISGEGIGNARVVQDLAILSLLSVATLVVGIILFRRGLQRAERVGGLSVIG